MSGYFQEQRSRLVEIFDAAVAAVSPATFLPSHLPPVPDQGRVFIFAVGKGAGAMARAAEAYYLDQGRIAPERLLGLAVARHGYGVPLTRLEMHESGHPVPDQASLDASVRMMALAAQCQPDDLVIFLLSGGASANLVAPVDGVSLADKQALNKALLRAGVPIDKINTVRKHVSRIKGGRFAKMVAPARLITLALSDVPGDDLSAIGSGPSIPDSTTLADARAVLDDFGVTVPQSIRAALLDPANETPKADDPAFAHASALVAARPRDAFEAACAKVKALGYDLHILGEELEGEARALAQAHAAQVLAARKPGVKRAYLSGGELTVTIRGNGRGGPNQEYALALALALNGAKGISALAADTDGTDGGVGAPTDPAGAFIDETTLARASSSGLDAAAMLDNNDSTGFFTALKDLHKPGPTLTNANDLRIILVDA